MGIGLPRFWYWICLVGARFVFASGLLEVEAAVGLMAGIALVDAMWCAMAPLNGVEPSPAGVVLLVIGGVVVSGLGVFRCFGLPPLGFAMLFAPSVQGCPLAMRMPTGCLEVGFVGLRLQSRTPLGLVL